MCLRWHNFDLYVADVGAGYRLGLTLDRIDNDGDYTPENVRWASYRVQARNRSTTVVSEEDISSMRLLYLGGEYTQREVAEAFGYTRDTVKHYLRGLRA